MSKQTKKTIIFFIQLLALTVVALTLNYLTQ
jgi:hypothetical protein